MSETKLLRAVRTATDALLRFVLRPMFNDIRRLDDKVSSIAATVADVILNDLHNDLLKRHQAIDQKQDLHTRLLNEANDKHDTQLQYIKSTAEGQNFSAYAHFGEAFRPQFQEIMCQALGDDFHSISRHAAQLFTEILIGHLHPGGIWRLQQDIEQFTRTKVQAPPATTNTALSATPSFPLKICVVTGCFPSLMHGGGGRLLDIITELAAEGHGIDLFSHFNPALDRSSCELLQGKVQHLHLVEDYEAFNVAGVEAWLRSINRDTGYYDVIQLEYPQSVRFVKQLRKYGRRIGFTFMESLAKSHTERLQLALEAEDYSNVSAQARSFWQALMDEKYALENADFCIAVTDDDAAFLKRLSSRTAVLVPTCLSRNLIIEEVARYSAIRSEENSVVFVGFFGHWPNIEAMEWYLADIHPLVKSTIPGYHFTIVGSGDVSRVKQLCAGDRTVTVTGMVDSIVPYILRAKVCISPLVSGAGIRGKQNQYAALGRPSVTTSIGNNGLVYRHGESVLIADAGQDFAAAIINLLTDKALYDSMRTHAQQLALEHYTWPRHLARLLDLYAGR